MNLQEHLLIIAQEECIEIAKEISKSLRFGLDDHSPDDPNKISNLNRINLEYSHLVAMIDMLCEAGIEIIPNHEEIINKKTRVKKFLGYSKQKGKLT